MNIEQILKEDKKHFLRGSLRDVIGDAYLMKHNPTFKYIREKSLQLKYQYVPAWVDYHVSPLNQLDNIIKSKKIPVICHRQWLKKMNKPIRLDCSFSNIPTKVESHHMHEAAHAVAHSFFKKINLVSRKEKILYSMLCESFANAVESFANAHVQNPTHYLFFNVNTYICDTIEVQKLKNKMVKDIGIKNTFLLIYFSYIYSNFLYEDVSTGLCQRIINEFGDNFKLSRRQLKDAHTIFRTGFTLSIDFRTNTTGFYLKSINLINKENILDILNFNFFKIIKNQKKWRTIFDQMVSDFELNVGGSHC